MFLSYKGYAAFEGVNLSELLGEAPTIVGRKSWRIKIMKNLMRLFSIVALSAFTLLSVGCDDNPELTAKVDAAADAFEHTVDSIYAAAGTLDEIKSNVTELNELEVQYAANAKTTEESLASTREAYNALAAHTAAMNKEADAAQASKDTAVASVNETTEKVRESVVGLEAVTMDHESVEFPQINVIEANTKKAE